LVKFKKGIPASVKQNVFLKMNAKVKEHIHTNAMKNGGDEEGVFLVNMSKNALEVLQSMNKINEIEYAELNYIYNHYANETRYTNGSLWGMYSSTTTPKNDFGSGAAAVWAKNKTGSTGSSTVYVGIIDEGYMYTHEDLKSNAGVNPGEIAGNRIDDDRNGLVDDVYGWDFAGNNNTIFDGVADDYILEIKTTQDATPDTLMKDFYNRQYHLQAGIYNLVSSKPIKYLIIETKAPYDAYIANASTEYIEKGQKLLSSVLNKFDKCMNENAWNKGYEYHAGEISIDLPPWVK
jgi:hypothetical protein